MHDLPAIPEGTRDAILAWYAANGRSLAFRRTTDPYAVLVSEAMAQQTQAARAAAYWERFMVRFPTVTALASATPADVLRVWQGLGYDRRAIALWRAARAIVTDHGGRVPDSIEALEALPGVGPYTARAVAALAFGHPVGPVDVNVRRVLGRMLAGDSLKTRDIQTIADAAVPPDRPGAWTHALMDIGATVCRLRNPRCDACPARSSCRYAAGPVTAPIARPARQRAAAPFPTTTRWLRGRILDRLRAARDGTWVDIGGPIGTHAVDRVRSAVTTMAAEGLVELTDDPGAGGIRARLATS